MNPKLKGEGRSSPGQAPLPASISALGVALGLIITKGHSEDPTKGLWPRSSGLSSVLGLSHLLLSFYVVIIMVF